MSTIPFQAINWSSIEKETHEGTTGHAMMQSVQFAGLRIRLVEYSAHYTADHWCELGHVVYCLEGEFVIELGTGEHIKQTKGESCAVSDGLTSHPLVSEKGAKLFIVDGDFLR
jgi:hypothetical protein